MLRSLIVAGFIILYAVFIGLPVLLFSILTGNQDLMYRWGVRCPRWAMRMAGIRIRVEGRERLQPGTSCVFMSNHVGNVDAPALIVSLPRVAALAKHELMKLPVLGRALRFTGFIPVFRGTQQAPEAVDHAVEALRRGRSLLVFPEGTRSRTGELLPFRRGVFLMTIRAGVPIVPITVLGSREIMRKGDPRIHPGEIRLIVHPPVPTAGLQEEDRYELAERVRAIIASALPPAAAPGTSGAAGPAEPGVPARPGAA